jgi:hypothetical protein
MSNEQGVKGVGSAWVRGLMVGALGLFGAGACGLPQDGSSPQDLQQDVQESGEAPSTQTFAVTDSDALPLTFVATLQNASRDGSTHECLIMSGNGQDTHPTRYLWGAGQNGFCGLSSAAELLANKQAVWTFTGIP